MRSNYCLRGLLLLALSALHSIAFGQTIVPKTIIGKVLSASDSTPVTGAFVYVRGKEKAAYTDEDGRFQVNVLPTDSSVMAQAIGYDAVEERITEETIQITVYLSKNERELSNGFYSRPVSENHAALGAVSGTPFQLSPYAGFEGNLQGRMAGLQVTQHEGQPSASVITRIRGTGSIYAGSEPLYVIDGLPMITGTDGDGGGSVGATYGFSSSHNSFLNTFDISTVEVLKDASATALYGSRGANGVILITTNRGRIGKTRFTGQYYGGVQSAASNSVKLANGSSYLNTLQEAYGNTYRRDQANNGTEPDALNNYLPYQVSGGDSTLTEDKARRESRDYRQQLLRPASFQKFDFSVSAGDSKLVFFTNLSYVTQKSVLKGSNFNRFSLRFNAENTASQALKIGITTALNIGEEYIQPSGYDTTAGYGMALGRALPIYPNQYQTIGEQRYQDNPFFNSFSGANTTLLQNRDFYYNERKVFRSLGTLFGQLDFGNHFRFRSEIGFDYINNINREYRNRLTRLSFAINSEGDTTLAPTTRASDFRQAYFTLTTNNYLTFKRSLNEKLRLEALAGVSTAQNITKYNGVSSENFPNDYSPLVSNGTRQTGLPTGGDEGYRINSGYLQAGVWLKDRYFFQWTGRLDASSRYGMDVPFQHSQTVSVGYNAAADGLEIKDKIENLRLRASSGVLGNSLIGNNSSDGFFKGGQRYILITFPGQYPNSMPNPNLRPEKHWHTNFGADFTLLKRIGVSLDAYQRRTLQLLQLLPLPLSAGFDYEYRFENQGEVTNTGLEATLSATIIDRSKFGWTVSLTSAYNQNRVADLGDVREGLGTIYQDQKLAQDESVGTFYLPKSAGFANADDPNGRWRTGDELVYNLQGQAVRPTSIAQLDSFRVVNSGKSALPTFYGGLLNQFRLGSFSLSVLVTWSGGNYILDRGEHLQSYVRAPGNNLRQDAVDGPGNLYYSGPYQSGNSTGNYTDPLSQRPTDRFLYKGDYLALKNLVFDYTLPQKVVRSLRIQGGKIFVQAQDFFKYSPYPNGDPEFAGNLQSPIARNMGQGVAYFNVPQLATYMAGINVTF